jgi:iron complex transport system permease protein
MAAHLDRHVDAPLRLILAGAALSAFFQGLTTAILLNQPNGYDQYRFWILGSLTGVTLGLLSWITPVILLALLLACSLARPLSALALGDEMAHALGHHPQKQRFLSASVVTLLTASAVALAGPIAFLGLLAPLLARPFYPHAPTKKMLCAAVCGAVLLLMADMLARSVMRPFEAPVSVITALLGAPILIWMARRKRVNSC